jgi:hypothetical protein
LRQVDENDPLLPVFGDEPGPQPGTQT